MDPFLGELRIFTYGFIPRGWMACNGQLLSISQNTALFALLGTTFGGDGRNTFGLPDLQGQVPLAVGTSTSGIAYTWGQKAGEAAHTLTVNEIPSHTHTVSASSATASSKTPTGSSWAVPTPNVYKPRASSTATTLATEALAITGSSTGHNNMQPFLGLTICIATVGIFPSRS
ncbi:phage tail protein [Paenibacillus sp. WLX1005]|uniref:phage tail protein n=1 Tax=Paenibacillus sp. WLX1005 TaxID=3243766 RepID=UPI0039845C61